MESIRKLQSCFKSPKFTCLCHIVPWAPIYVPVFKPSQWSCTKAKYKANSQCPEKIKSKGQSACIGCTVKIVVNPSCSIHSPWYLAYIQRFSELSWKSELTLNSFLQKDVCSLPEPAGTALCPCGSQYFI